MHVGLTVKVACFVTVVVCLVQVGMTVKVTVLVRTYSGVGLLAATRGVARRRAARAGRNFMVGDTVK